MAYRQMAGLPRERGEEYLLETMMLRMMMLTMMMLTTMTMLTPALTVLTTSL